MTQAMFIRETGGPEVLRLESHELGPPGPGQVRVRITAAGLNFIDVYFRAGVYPRPLPFILGLEGAGVVEAVGPEVQTLALRGHRISGTMNRTSWSNSRIAVQGLGEGRPERSEHAAS